jgi:hypothetical protein
MTWKAMMILPLALNAGCVTTTNSYCDIASPLYFDDSRTVVWLSEHDDKLLAEIIIANETWAALCE